MILGALMLGEFSGLGFGTVRGRQQDRGGRQADDGHQRRGGQTRNKAAVPPRLANFCQPLKTCPC